MWSGVEPHTLEDGTVQSPGETCHSSSVWIRECQVSLAGVTATCPICQTLKCQRRRDESYDLLDRLVEWPKFELFLLKWVYFLYMIFLFFICIFFIKDAIQIFLWNKFKNTNSISCLSYSAELNFGYSVKESKEHLLLYSESYFLVQ